MTMRRKLLAGVAALAFLLPSLALAQTNDGLKQQTVRGSTGTAYDYNGDWQALFDQAGIAPGPFNGRMLAWINQQLSANYTDLTSALDAFAISQGAPNWSSLGSFTIGGAFCPSVPALTPCQLTITSGLWSSPTDVKPDNQYVDGWTGDLKIAGAQAAGTTSAYHFSGDEWSTPHLSLSVGAPGYDASGNFCASCKSRTVYATGWLRQPYSSTGNQFLPTEQASAKGATIALAFNEYVYQGDVVSSATALSGLYSSGGTTLTLAASNIPVVNNSGRSYPRPIGVWMTEPGQRIGAGGSLTVEFFVDHAYAIGGNPVAAVTFTATDGTHTASKTVSSMSLSARQLSTSCTATNGSNILTGCGSTVGFFPGMKLTVPGVPGQPRVLSTTSNTITLGTNASVTYASGSITSASFTNATIDAGAGLGDGLFVGASFNCGSNLNGGSDVVITAEPTTAQVTISSGSATAAPWTFGAVTSSSAQTNQACTIKHVYQGTTGTVRVTSGVPIPVYSATFAQASDLAAFTDGVITIRAQALPNIGNVVLDTQTGADGTGNEWFGTAFNTNGTNVSPNIHNRWAMLDAAGKYAPVYAWVGASAGASPAVQTSSADPGSAAYYGSVSTAAAALASYYNTHGSHNDANGGIIYVKAGTTLSGFGGSLAAYSNANEPCLTISGEPGGDPTTIALNYSGSDTNNTVGKMMCFSSMTVTQSGTTGKIIIGGDASLPSSFPTYQAVFDKVQIVQGGVTNSAPYVYKIGTSFYYNALISETFGDANVLAPFASTSTSAALVSGSTLILGTYTTKKAFFHVFNALGNIGWNANTQQPNSTLFATNHDAIQPLSSVVAFNKWMGIADTIMAWPDTSATASTQNLAFTNNIIEPINENVAQSPALRISSDGVHTGSSNIVLHYNTVVGERTNRQYQEGVPVGNLAFSTATTGGTLSGGQTYYFQTTYALKTNPSVETATDGVPTGVAMAATSTGVFKTPTMPPDPNHVCYYYLDTVNPPQHLANNGSDLAAVPCGQQAMTITALGAARTPPVAGAPGISGQNLLKPDEMERFNIWQNSNMKQDTYTGSGANPDGSRVGSFARGYNVGNIGNLSVTGSVVGTGVTLGPSSGMGMVLGHGDLTGSGSNTDLSLVVYKSDRSWGGNGSTPDAPAINLGDGNYCPASSANVQQRVPAGFAAFPYDIEGNPRDNSGALGAGYAGAYEAACQ